MKVGLKNTCVVFKCENRRKIGFKTKKKFDSQSQFSTSLCQHFQPSSRMGLSPRCSKIVLEKHILHVGVR